MAEKEVFLTREGYDNLKNELEELKVILKKSNRLISRGIFKLILKS